MYCGMDTHLSSLLSATETAGFLSAEVAAAVFLEGRKEGSTVNTLKLHVCISACDKLNLVLKIFTYVSKLTTGDASFPFIPHN